MEKGVGARFALVLLVALLAASAVRSQKPLPLADLGELKLRVAKVEVVPEIAETPRPWRSQTGRLSREEGWNLVVVSLNGQAARPCDLLAANREFYALIEGPVGPQLVASEAIAFGEDWSIRPEDADMITVRQSVPVAGPLTIRLAFFLPEDVTQFTVRYPATATGTARLSTR